MATVVLGTVLAVGGAAIGGPVGAQIGWAVGTMIGASIDASRQHQDVGKLTDLRASSSSYGTPICQAWGETEVGCSVVWLAQDHNGKHLVEHKDSQHEGGGSGGGPTVNHFWYTTSLAAIIGQGTICKSDGTLVHRNMRLTRLWADDEIVWEYNSNNNLVDLTFHDGAQDQVVDSFIESWVSSYPEQYLGGVAPAYRGRAYFVIKDMDLSDFSNRIPNLRAEITTDDVSLGDILGDVVGQVDLPLDELDLTDVADISIIGSIADNRIDAQSILNGLCQAYAVDPVEVDGVLRFVSRGKDSIATITLDDLGAKENNQSDSGSSDDTYTYVTTTIQQLVELPNQLDVAYYIYDKNNGSTRRFEHGIQTAVRATRESQSKQTLSFPITWTDDIARGVAFRSLDAMWTELPQHGFSLLPKFMRLCPADVIMLPVGGSLERVRLTSVETGIPGEIRCQGVRDDADVYNQSTAQGSAYGSRSIVSAASNQSIVPTDFNLISGSELRQQDQSQVGFYVGATGASGWSGCFVYYSSDDTNWTQAGSIPGASVLGTTTDTLADGTTPETWDMVSTVNIVTIDGGQLASTSASNVINGNNIIYIGNEILGFTAANLETDGSYTLSGLYRGLRGSPMTGHTSADQVTLCTSKLMRVSVPSSLEGDTVYVRCVSRYQVLTDVTSKTIIIAARTLLPVEVTANDALSGNPPSPVGVTDGYVLTAESDAMVWQANPGTGLVVTGTPADGDVPIYDHTIPGAAWGPQTGGGGSTILTPDVIYGSDLIAWYEADSLLGTGVTLPANGTAVSQWNDLSGNANHLTSTGTHRPLFTTNKINGLPGVDFDGVDDYLQAPSQIIPVTDFLWVVVFQVDVTSTGRLFGTEDSGVSTNGFALLNNGGGQRLNYTVIRDAVGSSSADIPHFTSVGPGQYVSMMWMLKSGPGARVWMDGSIIGVSGATTWNYGTPTKLAIGNSGSLNNPCLCTVVGAFLVTPMGNSNKRQQLQAYIDDKWAL